MQGGIIRAVSRTLGVLACGAALALLAPGDAQALMTQGAAVERVLEVGGKQIPLPEGRWVVAGDAGTSYDGERVGAYGVIRNIVLFRLQGRAVDAVAEINTNELPTTDGWGVAADCRRTDIALSVVRYMAGWDASCFFVTHTLTSTSGLPAGWQQAAGYAQREGLAMAPVWLTAGFRVANRQNIVDARFHFAPAARGISVETPRRWSDSAWSASRIESDPARMALGVAVTEWAVLFSGFIETGIKNRLPATGTFPMPSRPDAPLQGGIVERRLQALEDLRRSGVLTQEQFQAQSERLREHGLDPGSQVVDPSTIALYKTLAYRPIVSFINVFLDYYWIGYPYAAGVLVFLQVTVNSTKFYFHELAWERFGAISARRDSARTVDFSYYGTNA
jgi:uncharacterized membrane protein